MVLVELGVVEQRYQAVLEVLNDGATVTDVARRNGVARQTVHVWLRRYASDGLPGLVDRFGEAVVVSASDAAGGRGADRGDASWAAGVGSAFDRFRLDREGVVPLPGRSSIYRCLVRHGLIDAAGA